MAEIERVSEADRMEQANLERVIADVERTLHAQPPGTRPFFDGFLLNARARLGALDKKIHDEEHEKEQERSNEVAMASLAEKETALNANEKAEYNGFLKEDLFTKKDFNRLDEFYAQSWDRLSEGGKEQMSHRIWEGVRRDEYKFTDLPETVREKETKQAYMRLRDSSTGLGSAATIPERDRSDFINAYESGNRDEATKILDRDSFRQNMFRDENSKAVRHSAQNVTTMAEGASILAIVKADPSDKGTQPAKPPSNIDVTSVDLSGIKLPDSASQGAIANLPRTQSGVSREA